MSNLHPIFEQALRHIAPPQPAIKRFGVDVRTTDRQKLINRLKVVPGVFSVQSGGPYWSVPEYSQVWLETTMSEREFEDWMHNTNLHYEGIFERSDT